MEEIQNYRIMYAVSQAEVAALRCLLKEKEQEIKILKEQILKGVKNGSDHSWFS